MKPNIRMIDELSEFEKLALQNFSYSRLSAYDWCKAQYFYNYILKYPQEYGDKALLGNMIHTALEVTLVDGEVIQPGELYDNYRAAREEHDPNNEIVSDELFETGFPMLEDFLARQAKAPVRITEAEHEFQFVFNGVLLRGFIDKIVVGDTTVSIVDYKSGAYEVPDKHVHSDLQLGIYSLYMKYLHPDKTITAGLHYLRSNKLKQHTFTDEDFVDVENRLREAIDAVRDTKQFHPVGKNMAWKCRLCTYQKTGECKAGVFNVNQNDKKKNRLIGDGYT